MEGQRKSARLQSLEFLRIIMTGIIFLSHCEFLTKYSYGEIYSNYFHNATMGVDFFFMLSGFGMMLSFLKKGNTDSAFAFAKNKIIKIYPVYVLSLIVSLPYQFANDSFSGNITAGEVVKLVIKFVLCLTLLQSITGMTRFSHMLNGVCWFLSCLFIIYLVAPQLMRLIKKVAITRKRNAALLIGTIIVASIIKEYFIIIEGVTVFDDLHYGSPYIRLFYVMIGMLLANAYAFRPTKGTYITQRWGTWQEAFVILSSLLWFLLKNTAVSIIDSMFITVIDIVICSSLLYVFSQQQGTISNRIMENKITKYSPYVMYIYLLHYPVRNYIDIIFEHNIIVFGDLTGIFEMLAIFIITVLLSALSYYILGKMQNKVIV